MPVEHKTTLIQKKEGASRQSRTMRFLREVKEAGKFAAKHPIETAMLFGAAMAAVSSQASSSEKKAGINTPTSIISEGGNMLVFQAFKDSTVAAQDTSSAKKGPAVDSKEWFAQVKGQIGPVLTWMAQADKVNADRSITAEDKKTLFLSIGRKLTEDVEALNLNLVKSSRLSEPAFEVASTYLSDLVGLMGRPPSVEKLSMKLYSDALATLSKALDEMSKPEPVVSAPAGKQKTKVVPGAAKQGKVGMKDVPVKTKSQDVTAEKIESWISALPTEKSAAINKKITSLTTKYKKSRQQVLQAAETSINADAGPVKKNALKSEDADKYQMLDTFLSEIMLRRHLK